ncbi:MAG: site-2 protease family protein [Chloroflexaceae bacterium]|nr:site-2 protease family protein [Chloroflexaceae bacterium]
MESQEFAQRGEQVRRIAANVMDITDISDAPQHRAGALRLRGYLQRDPETAYHYIEPRLSNLGYTTLLRQEDDKVSLIALPGRLEAGQSKLWLALLLFALTILSTIFVGGNGLVLVALWLQSGQFVPEAFQLGLGLAFSAAILSILLAHELGHFLMARHLRVAVSYPFFIPMPISPLGTMGAVIAMKAPPPDRRALLSIAIAGPLAGLAVAIPVLVLGLSLSEVQSPPPNQTLLLEGNSLLYAAIKVAVFGRFLPDGGLDVMLHPVAFAGWVGLLVTGLNLIPAGQLDGGHILYALVGPRIASIVTWVIAVVLLGLGLLWPGWFLWAVLILVFGQRRAPLLNELTPLTQRQQLVALLGLIIFVLVFTPAPLTIVEPGL